ncbi:hypothetical protein BLNAU_4729 [Blattamonas nauphoetae]|uniref:Uncharacterized protein n=1 Tax=Blattamonas nauphoetae TaxID=2049346 RepID=A0ABQ9Y8T2_9EUKA|nr:hypothetical protein BLNAU_4729 [Blattamonas nauphoetae]
MGCSPFLNWSEEVPKTVDEWAVIFRSLVSTVNSQPALDVTLEAKAVQFLETVDPEDEEMADALLSSRVSSSDDSWTNFIQCIVVLISSPSLVITAATMEMLGTLIRNCSTKVHFTLVKADLIPQLVITLNILSLSFTEAEDIHTNLVKIIDNCLFLSTPLGLSLLRIKDREKRQTVHETVLKHVLVPSEEYICHLCVNRFSIVDGDQSKSFLALLAQILERSPYYRPTLEFVLNTPVILTIPSCLTYFDNDDSILKFMRLMAEIQDRWNTQRGYERHIWKTMDQMLRMEGFCDAIEQRLRNDQDTNSGRFIGLFSIEWNNKLGTNLPYH